MHTPAQHAYLSPDEAADYLRSSRSTLARLRLYGGGPRFCKIGRAVRYRRDDLDAWMNATAATSTTTAAGHKGAAR